MRAKFINEIEGIPWNRTDVTKAPVIGKVITRKLTWIGDDGSRQVMPSTEMKVVAISGDVYICNTWYKPGVPQVVHKDMVEKYIPDKSMNESRYFSKYKKGDKVKYIIWFHASTMLATSKAEKSPIYIDRIEKVKKDWTGIRYLLNGILVPECDIIGLVNEEMQIPFSNKNKNRPIRQRYPLSNLNYEGIDKKITKVNLSNGKVVTIPDVSPDDHYNIYRSLRMMGYSDKESNSFKIL
jgi:hypothetical protein